MFIGHDSCHRYGRRGTTCRTIDISSYGMAADRQYNDDNNVDQHKIWPIIYWSFVSSYRKWNLGELGIEGRERMSADFDRTMHFSIYRVLLVALFQWNFKFQEIRLPILELQWYFVTLICNIFISFVYVKVRKIPMACERKIVSFQVERHRNTQRQRYFSKKADWNIGNFFIRKTRVKVTMKLERLSNDNCFVKIFLDI